MNFQNQIACLLILLGLSERTLSQISFQVGGNLDIMMSQGQENSSFYYNGIDRNNRDLRVGLYELNLLGGVEFSSQWELHSQLQVNRHYDESFDHAKLSQLHLKWKSKQEDWQLKLGRFFTPFGAYYGEPFSQDRKIIDLPLFYSYYINMSGYVGYSPGLFERRGISHGGKRDWGMPNAYPQGYTNGVHIWNQVGEENPITWELALVHGAPMVKDAFSDPIHPSLIARVRFSPAVFWKQGFSISHGGYLQEAAANASIEKLGDFRQTLIGTDFTLGYSYFELTGEILWGHYSAPFFESDTTLFLQDSQGAVSSQSFSNWSTYLIASYDISSLPGAYIVYQFDGIFFNKPEELGENQAWDDRVIRHSLGVGYAITRNLLIRSTYSFFHVQNREWELDTWRTMLTLHL